MSTPMYYADYLGLDSILNAQHMKSVELGTPAHDEMLFIIIHQTYELWFKQILHELDSVLDMFERDTVDEKSIGIAVARLRRVTEIQKILIDQLRVLETMTPLDFLDFRDVLVPASGFQSFQFRLVENKLGLRPEQRLLYNKFSYHTRLTDEHRRIMEESERGPNLFKAIERWLERTPFLEVEDFRFDNAYRDAVKRMLDRDEKLIADNPTLNEDEKHMQLEGLTLTREHFEALFDPEKYEELERKGLRRLSFRATQAAILIALYRDQPILQLPYRLIEALIDMDELFTTWRYRHALMVLRMIGSKIGTGGSSGHHYLKETADTHKVFSDLTNLSTFLIPRKEIPPLPSHVERSLGFFYTS